MRQTYPALGLVRIRHERSPVCNERVPVHSRRVLEDSVCARSYRRDAAPGAPPSRLFHSRLHACLLCCCLGWRAHVVYAAVLDQVPHSTQWAMHFLVVIAPCPRASLQPDRRGVRHEHDRTLHDVPQVSRAPASGEPRMLWNFDARTKASRHYSTA